MQQSYKIVHVSNFNTRKDGLVFNSSTDRKISNGLIRNGHFVYDFSYRDIARARNPFGSKHFGIGRMNRALVATCINVAPEILLLGHSESILPETLVEIRHHLPDLCIGLWWQDALWTGDVEHLRRRLPHLDVVFLSTGGDVMAGYKTNTNRVAYFPNLVDGSIERLRNFEQTDLPIDLLYCGRNNGTDIDERSTFVAALKERLIDIEFDVNGSHGAPLVFGAAYEAKLGSSKMGLNYSRRNDFFMCSSARLAQLTGNGLLTLTPRIPGMERLFDESEVAYVDDIDDTVEKACFYSRNDCARRQVAEAGWRRAHASFNATRVTKFMMETLMQSPYSEDYEWQEEVI